MVATAGISEAPDISTKLSKKEADQLAHHFKDPTFCKLFGEFAREMADPQAKAEQDAYLAQLEAEGQVEGVYGRGAQVIQADSGIVVKTKTADGASRVYINICTCSKVENMVIEQSRSERRGSNIKLPNIITTNGIKEGKAPDGATFKTWDFTVHPDALLQCMSAPQLLEHLIIIAIERLEESTGIKLLRKYKLPAVQYKGVNGEERPAAIMQRRPGEGDVVDGRIRPLAAPLVSAGAQSPAPAAPTAGDAVQGADPAQHKAGGRSSFSFKAKSTAALDSTTDTAHKAASAAPGTSARVCTPEYQVVERARADLGRAWSDTGRGLHFNNIPEALVVRVELPGVASAAGVDLCLTADSVALDVPGKYQLRLPLKYKVDDKQASAKYVTSKQLMVLTLPVLPPEPQHCSPLQREAQGTLDTTAPALSIPGRRLSDGEQASTSCAGSPVAVSADTCSSTGRQLDSSPDAGTACAPVLPAGCAECSTDSSLQCPALSKTENQLNWEELHSQAVAGLQDHAHSGTTAGKEPAANSEPAQVHQQQALPVAASKAAVALMPRLSSRRVGPGDLL